MEAAAQEAPSGFKFEKVRIKGRGIFLDEKDQRFPKLWTLFHTQAEKRLDLSGILSGCLSHADFGRPVMMRTTFPSGRKRFAVQIQISWDPLVGGSS